MSCCPLPARERNADMARSNTLLPPRPATRRFAARPRPPELVNQKNLPWIAGISFGLWWLLSPKKAYSLEAGKKYRYETSVEPPLPDTNAALRLGGAIADAGNVRVTVSQKTASYDVEQNNTSELTPGRVLTVFEGSNIVFRTARRID